jgi:hypothetical protein
MASVPQICGLLPPPDRNDVLFAVAKTIGLIRRRGFTAKDIARSLKQPNGDPPDPDTISRAERAENLLSADLMAQLAFIYQECADPIRALFEPAPTAEPTTLEERLQRAEAEIMAVRRELVSREGE